MKTTLAVETGPGTAAPPGRYQGLPAVAMMFL